MFQDLKEVTTDKQYKYLKSIGLFVFIAAGAFIIYEKILSIKANKATIEASEKTKNKI
jgi:uncharacterized lipoprotein NlpE involved in copper resistance